MFEWETAIEQRRAEAVEEWARRAGPTAPVYLYFREATGPEVCGPLRVIPEEGFIPEGFTLATGDPMPANRDRAGIAHWIREHTGRIPILAP